MPSWAAGPWLESEHLLEKRERFLEGWRGELANAAYETLSINSPDLIQHDEAVLAVELARPPEWVWMTG